MPLCRPEDRNYYGPQNVYKKQARVSLAVVLALPPGHPKEMVGDCVELHEVQEHLGDRGVHFQGPRTLGEESCKILYTPDGKVVMKPNKPAVSQYFKVLKPILWDQHPRWSAVPMPHPSQHAHCGRQRFQKHSEPDLQLHGLPYVDGREGPRPFFLDLLKYLQAFMGSGMPVPKFVSLNAIGERYMDPKEYLYRELYAHAKYNELI